MARQQPITLGRGPIDLAQAAAIAFGAEIRLDASVKKRLAEGHRFVADIAGGDAPAYGINTGFGYLANAKIGKKDLRLLQKNILRSHSSGWGPLLSIPETRLAMALRLNVLVQGCTGVRYLLCEQMLQLVRHHIYPLIPEYGSVGASGDLIPLAHLALPLIGEGNVLYKDKVVPAARALKLEGLKPIELAEKEGLGLVNGTQIMLAVGGLALWEGLKLLKRADESAALSFEALIGAPGALDRRIHEVRRQVGQQESAKAILALLKGSYLFNSSTKRLRVQDPYSLRCTPQIHGPSRDALHYAESVIDRELNGVTDNPLVFPKEGLLLNGGNFHGQALAMAFDFAAIAVAELGNVSERRLELLLNPHMSGLPAFLAADAGVDSGYMALQYLSACLVNEDKVLANPACTDSIPGNVGIEDHVSMGMTSARKLKKIVENVRTILTVERLAAAQAIDMRGTTKLGTGTRRIYDALRARVPTLKGDRPLSAEIETARTLLAEAP